MPLSSRYQPDGSLGRNAGKGERNYLSSEEGESELTESESHLNMLKGGSSTLQTVLHPPVSPSEHSSSVVNMSISVLGMQPTSRKIFFFFLIISRPSSSWHIFTHVFVCPQIAVIAVCIISYLTTYHFESIAGLEVWILAVLAVCLLIFCSCIFMVCRQPQTTKKVSFMVCSSSMQSVIQQNGPASRSYPARSHYIFFVIIIITGTPSAFSASSEHICEYLPHGSAEWRHLDTFLRVDGCWWVAIDGLLKTIRRTMT